MLRKPLKMLDAAIHFNLSGKRNLVKVGHRITHKCNYKCAYCSLWNDDVNELNTEEVLGLVDEVADMGCVIYAISGGEPLLRKDLPLILKRIKKRGMTAKIVTNGSLVKKRIDEICEYIDVMNFSFDTMNESIPDMGTIKVLNDTVLEGIKAAVEKIPHVGLNMVLTRESPRELDGILKYCTSLGIKTFTFFPLIKHFDYKTPDEIAEYYDEIYGGLDNYKSAIMKLRELRDGGMRIAMSDAMLDALYTFKIPKMNCISGYMSCGISPDGRLSTCYEFFKKSTGSFKDKSFKELWEELGDHLDVVDNCRGCLLHCYFEPNAIFSTNPRAIFNYGERYFMSLLKG
ncbi:MAG: coenzyme PQQ biosynthesis protein E [bacterium]|nr:MAG: coenzyme PQQ biosynthesis protein E [bacterium]